MSDADRERIGNMFDKTFRTLDGNGMPDGQIVATVVALKKLLKRLNLTFGAVLDMAASGHDQETLKAFELANEALKASEEFLVQENDRLSRLLNYYRVRHKDKSSPAIEFEEDVLKELLVQTQEEMRKFAADVLPFLTRTDAQKSAQAHYESRVGAALAKQQTEVDKNFWAKGLLWLLQKSGHDVSPEHVEELKTTVSEQQKAIKELSEGIVNTGSKIEINMQVIGPKLDLIRGATAPQADYDAALRDIKILTETVEQLKQENGLLQSDAAEVKRLKEEFEDLQKQAYRAETGNFNGDYTVGQLKHMLIELRTKRIALERQHAHEVERLQNTLQSAWDEAIRKDREIDTQRARIRELEGITHKSGSPWLPIGAVLGILVTMAGLDLLGTSSKKPGNDNNVCQQESVPPRPATLHTPSPIN